MNEVVIPLKLSGIAALKAELKDLKNQMADAANPEAFAALADKAGDVQKQISKVNNSINEFKKGSNLDQAKASFDAMGESIIKLDFTKAAKQSANLKQTLGSLTPKDLIKGFEGFIVTLKNLGGAFIKLGVTILMNPIFLLVAAVTAIIAVIALVLNKFGLLDGVIKALMMPINALIAGFKAITDWLGLTSFAAEENAERTAAANKKVSESSKAREAQVVGDLGREIAELKAAGKETAKLEEEVSNTKIKEANIRKKGYKKELEDIKDLDGKFYDDKRLELKKQVDAENEIIKQGYSEKEVAKNNANKKESDDTDKKEKETSDKAKAAREKRIAADKESEAEIALAAKVVSDSKKTAQQVEIDDLKAAYKKKIETAQKFNNDTTALVEAQKIQEAKIIKKYNDDANTNRIAVEDAAFLEMKRLTLSETEFKKLQATQAAEAKMDQFTKDAEMVKLLEKELAAELVKIQDDANKQKTADLKKETDKQKAINDAALQAKKSIINSEIDAAKGLVNLLGGLAEKNKKIQKAALIANAALSIAEIINNTNVGGSKEVATKGVLGLGTSALLYIKMATSIGAVIGATAKGLSALGGGSVSAPSDTGAGGGGGGATATTAVAPASAPQLFGQANTGSQINAGGNSNQNITVTAVVSETEMTATQHFINNIQQNSVL
jgi:hypothetical protein